jgi:hypothetical protein
VDDLAYRGDGDRAVDRRCARGKSPQGLIVVIDVSVLHPVLTRTVRMTDSEDMGMNGQTSDAGYFMTRVVLMSIKRQVR